MSSVVWVFTLLLSEPLLILSKKVFLDSIKSPFLMWSCTYVKNVATQNHTNQDYSFSAMLSPPPNPRAGSKIFKSVRLWRTNEASPPSPRAPFPPPPELPKETFIYNLKLKLLFELKMKSDFRIFHAFLPSTILYTNRRQ